MTGLLNPKIVGKSTIFFFVVLVVHPDQGIFFSSGGGQPYFSPNQVLGGGLKLLN